VVRGLLAKPSVDHITVIEIDQQIIDVIGPEFASDPRVSIYQDDALKWEPGDRRFDFAWHDIWTERNEGLQALHGRLMRKHRDIPLENQGAWNFPRLTHRSIAKIFGKPLLGGPTRRFSCVT
jgi:predicted membrane-bound spermidine synthase